MRTFFVLFLFLTATTFSSTVYAQVRSNSVTTTVGTPTGPAPNASTTTNPTNSGPLGVTLTCPFFQSGQGSVNVTCGTARNPVNNCGHGGIGYPQPCNPRIYACVGGQYSNQLRAAVDVRPSGSNGGGAPVYLPFINGNQKVNWVKVSGPIPINAGAWGDKVEYATTYNGKSIRVDLTHLSPGVILSSAESGTQIGTTKPGVDGGSSGHLHTAASIDGIWEDSIDRTYLCSNRTP